MRTASLWDTWQSFLRGRVVLMPAETAPIDQPSMLRESLWLASTTGRYKWAVPFMVVLGLAAAAAEMLGVGLSVLFLFALLGQGQDIIENGGILAELMLRVESMFGSNPTLIAGIFFAMILLKAIVLYANDIATSHLLNNIAQNIRDQLHRNYVTMGYVYLQKRDHGALLNTLSTESWAVADALYSLSRIGVNLCAVAVFAVGMFALSWVVALTSLCCAALAFALLRLLSHPVQKLGQKTLAANQVLAERMLISLNGMRTLRAFAKEQHVLDVFEAISTRVKTLAVRTERVKALLGPIGEIAGLGTLIVVALMANWVGVDVPTMIASVLLLFRLQPHLYAIEADRLNLAGIGASLTNVRRMLGKSDKPWPVEGNREFNGLDNEIRFQDLAFTHDPRSGPSVLDISFSIPVGKTTIISGPSGSGKTTILNLLLRLYEPDRGVILVDDEDLSKFTRTSWLADVAISGQDIDLIDTTVAQNLRLARPDASNDSLVEVCKLVEIWDDLSLLPDGLDTPVGASGLNFSGGQRQRIGLARALLSNPKILVLDEAMSALEPALEDRIRNRIKEQLNGVTIIVVSHRSGSEIGADHLIRVKNGRINSITTDASQGAT